MDPQKKNPKKYAEINLSTYRNKSKKLNSLNLLETTLEVCSRNQPFPNAAITRILLRSVFLVDQNAETHLLGWSNAHKVPRWHREEGRHLFQFDCARRRAALRLDNRLYAIPRVVCLRGSL